MFQEQDDSRDGKLPSHCRDEVAIDDRGTNVLETSRNSLQNFDWVLAVRTLPVSAVQPGGNRQDDHDEGIPENG